ncbi:membrane integrity-associated transporter subunit PqiC [Acetobacter sacchari]|uniref:Membrane integrity-associated transporter subunit PqiC n=1 Tax=Acetobacter sacchari TaxID=2661687 RepID=A0ABS3LVL7_9PROT|nr:PqiC family protein [Acetobacter sacchari]MBO1359960.1 membrane integrity-associated transporter subunit PqiC [Acetobacter sacchari]
MMPRLFRVSSRPSAATTLSSLLACAAVVSLAACGSSDPTLYTLAPVAGQPSPVLPAVNSVEVRLPTISAGLDRDRIVLSDSGYKLDVASSDAWSEPLASQIAHVLAGELGQRLPGVNLVVQNDAITGTPQAFVELVVNRFSRDASGQAILDVQAAVRLASADDGAPFNRRILLSTPAGFGTKGLVAALSALLGQAADQIAAQIRALPPSVTAR